MSEVAPETIAANASSGGALGVEDQVIDLFVTLATTFHLPRSLGAIYGYLFCHKQPVAFDELVDALELSKGSVSSGLKALQQLQAVRPVTVGDDRRSFYEAEIQMRRLLSGFISAELRPQLRVVEDKLDQLDHELSENPSEETRVLAERVGKLRNWSRSAKTLLPAMQNVFGF